MLTESDNQLLTEVGRDTQMGNLLRRYWHVVGIVAEFEEQATKAVRIFGEDLVLYKTRSGEFGLMGEHCLHRSASLVFGIPTETGLRCPYHGWCYDTTGQCIEQPNEPAGSAFKDRMRLDAYPVEELGGLLFAYLGPEPRPLLPRFDGFVVGGAIRAIGWAVVPCNWLQIMENSMDPVHAEWLHGHLQEYVEEAKGVKYSMSARHVDIAFEEFEYGIYKKRLLEGQSLDVDDWRVGHPLIFPNMLAVGSADADFKMYAFQIRIPMDDANTMHYWYYALVPPAGRAVPEGLIDSSCTFEVPFKDARGKFLLDFVDGQDIMAWTTQGVVANRTRENLGWSDRGVALLRKILKRELKNVEAGKDPLGVIRDPERAKLIEFHLEQGKKAFADGFGSLMNRLPLRYAPIANELGAVFAKPETVAR
jgi:5,5'-dehydrodivanillate O-demethylase